MDRFGSAPVAHKTLAVSRRLRCEDKKPDRYWSAPLACEKASARETIISEEIALPGLEESIRQMSFRRSLLLQLAGETSQVPQIRRTRENFPSYFNPFAKTTFASSSPSQASQPVRSPLGTCEGPSNRRGTAAFRKYRAVSVSGIGLQKRAIPAPGLRGRFLVSRFCWTAGPGTGSPSSWARPPRTKEKLMKPSTSISGPPHTMRKISPGGPLIEVKRTAILWRGNAGF